MIKTRRAKILAAATGSLLAATALGLTIGGTAEAATGPQPGTPQIMCMDIYKPVLGSDGKIYPNDCYATRAGVSVIGPAPVATGPGIQVPPQPGMPVPMPTDMPLQRTTVPATVTSGNGWLNVSFPWSQTQGPGPGIPGWVNGHGPAPAQIPVNGQGPASGQSSAYSQASAYGSGSAYGQNPGGSQGSTPDETALCPPDLPDGAVC